MTKLEILNVAGNQIHTFKIFDILQQMQNLKEVYFYDPNYGTNPICEFPNYDIMVGCLLPQIETIDTFSITKKFRSICESRKREVKIYYSAISANEASYCESLKSEFYRNLDKIISDIPFTIELNHEVFDKINEIASRFDHYYKEFKYTATELPMLEYKTAGLLHSTRLLEDYQEWNDFSSNISQFVERSTKLDIAAIWEISNVGATHFLEEFKAQKTPKVIVYDLASEAISALCNWTESQHEFSSIINPKSQDTYFVVFCDVVEQNNEVESAPTYLMMVSTPTDSLLTECENLISQMIKQSQKLKEISDGETLVQVQNKFTLTETLTKITLINCEINSLAAFNGLINLKELNVPFNRIESITDLPPLPALSVLDISFNLVENVNYLIPNDKSMIDNISQMYIIGNPVYSHTTNMFIKTIFKGLQNDKPSSVLFSPPNDDTFYLTSLSNNFSSLENLQTLDISSNAITTLKPLCKLQKLTKLMASGNQLTKIDIASQNLTYLDVSSNFIEEMPISQTLPSLQFLLMPNNKLKKLQQFTSLLALFIGNNDIDEIPQSNFYPNLIILSMENNPLMEEVDMNRLLFQFKTLKMLNGQPIKQSQHNKVQNQLQGILFPEEIGALLKKGQTSLDLSEKNYKNVDILASDTLQALNLSNNNLSEIKWPKNPFPKLQNLMISGNSLTNFDFLLCLPHLRALDLSNNKIGDSLCKILVTFQLHNLKSLNLSYNSIKTHPILPRSNFPNIELLDLSHNYVMTIERGTFSELQLLSSDLSYNSLKKLDNINCQSLTFLDVSHNRITTVDEVEKLRNLTNLAKFNFNDNPLNQRTIHRIRVLCILRSVKEIDGKPVTESDLMQVKQILEQNSAMGVLPPEPQAPPGKVNRINNIIMSPNLPALHEAPTPKRNKDRPNPRFPR
ncbi:Leucine Rich Repeat family protein [Trichomonas vaginalis G3]|uniref:Leucine Rich Repeat family protein n=1 Tax=Trichomonas vaginalis (strain ATCC PRA-98 / G3) TaxID=412133 RepID=A2EJE3_TRIV3|nr:uncharacterized protein TVAGG3_0389500 [Trichomonas vaginalis G3]EAY07200.1 Leucine Rich Repeat family protein [Trichomonas vaginalis G3]KAI5533888.1 regulation of response to stimulus [Trichomonas vaginalis G3]|eukprot:XP_001319423.1 hypothetical protein [Trichomonas vaginalis G3]